MNNEAQFGLRFAVKNAKQVQKTIDAINAQMKKLQQTTKQASTKVDSLGEQITQTGKKGKSAFKDGIKNAESMSKSLDKVVKKWLSIGGAVTIVATLMRRTFAKIDEYIGLKRMANTAGIAAEKIGSLGKKLKELYGGDASSAASAYTSLSDILGAAKAGRGISQDVVMAASRYGIGLNGGMISEDQLMTNIAKAMKAQRNRGNMFGVREIASAFGIDEAMMLHLSERGANWDRNLPKYQMAEAEAAATKAREMQMKVEQFMDWMIVRGLNILEKLGVWLDKKLGNDEPIPKKNASGGYIIGNTWYNTNSSEEALRQWRLDEYSKKYPNEQVGIITNGKTTPINNSDVYAALAAAKTQKLQGLVDYFGNGVATSSGTLNALYGLNKSLSVEGGSAALLPTAQPTILLRVVDESGALKDQTIKVSSTGNFAFATPVK